MLRSKPIVPGYRLLIYTGYKYNVRKVLSLTVTDNVGIKKTGIPYLSKYSDQFTNISNRPVARPLVMSKKSAFNEVDSPKISRQSDL